MKRFYVLILMFVLSINMMACSSEQAKSVSTTTASEEVEEATLEDITEIEDLVLESKPALTQERPALQKSTFADELRALDYGEAKVIYSMPAEKELLGEEYTSEELLQQIKESDLDSAPFLVEILYKHQDSDGEWTVFVLIDYDGEPEVREYAVGHGNVIWITTYPLEMFEETAEEKGYYIEQQDEEKGVFKTLTASEIKEIYPDLPWDTDIVRPIKIKLYKDDDGRCSVIFVFPKGTGVFTSGFSLVNQQTNYLFGHDANLLTESRVADYGYLIHDLVDDSVNVVFADLSYKHDFNNWRIVKFRLTDDRQRLRDHQPSKGMYDKGINGMYDFRD